MSTNITVLYTITILNDAFVQYFFKSIDMKKIIPFLLVPVLSWSQSAPRKASTPSLASNRDIGAANVLSLPARNGAVFYEAVDSNFKKDQINVYRSAKMWLADYFKDSKSVLQVDDQNLGELVGKGTFRFSVTYSGQEIPNWCRFTVKISCRNNKYRIQVYDIATRVESGAPDYTSVDGLNGSNDPLAQAILHRVDDRIGILLKDAHKAIALEKDTF